MSEFDDLYNDFFNGDDEKNKLGKMMKKFIDLNDGIFKGLDNLNIKKLNLNSNGEDKLGKPTSVETYVVDGVTFEKTEWKTEFGSIIKVVTKDGSNIDPIELIKPYTWSDTIEELEDISLDERLEMAVKEENYELAVEIRDLIAKKNKEKNEVKTIDNEDVDGGDEWNF